MLTAFVHFSPADENPKLISGNWLIEDVTVENVDHFYRYNYKDGLWQTGKPATNIQFKAVRAFNLLSAFNIVGDTARQFNLSIENSTFSFREGATNIADAFEGVKMQSPAFFYATNFNGIKLRKVTLQKKGAAVLVNCKSGNSFMLNRTKLITEVTAVPFSIIKVKKVSKDGRTLNPAKETIQ